MFSKNYERKKIYRRSRTARKLAPIAKVSIKRQVFVCNGKSCLAVGAAAVKAAFEAELQKKNLRFGKAAKGRNPNGEIVLTDCGSVGLCSVGTAVLIYPEGVWYAQVRAEDVREIVEEHLENGRVVERLALIEDFGSEKK